MLRFMKWVLAKVLGPTTEWVSGRFRYVLDKKIVHAGKTYWSSFLSFLWCYYYFLSTNKCVHVSIPWLLDHPKAYWALYNLLASKEFIAKSGMARQSRGSGGGHTYDPDWCIRMSKRMVRKIVTKKHSKYIYATNSYPQECESGERSPNVKVWKLGHRGSDPSNTDQLCTPVAQVQLGSC
jgi:hypothetical protein